MHRIVIFVVIITVINCAVFKASAAIANETDELRNQQLTELALLTTNEAMLNSSERLAKSSELYFEYTLLLWPELGTYMGIEKHQDKWSDSSIARRKKYAEETTKWFNLFKSINPTNLSKEDRLNLTMLIYTLETEIAREQFDGVLMPIDQLTGIYQDAARVLAMMPVRNEHDLNNIIARLSGIEMEITHTIEWMKLGLAKGVTPPKVTLTNIPDILNNQLAADTEQSPYLTAFASKPEMVSQQTFNSLKDQAQRIVKNSVHPSLEMLHDFMVNEYIPRSRETIGLSNLPNGKAWYTFNVQEFTTTSLTPEQIHELGLKEVARIRKEMEQAITSSGFEGSFDEFLHFLRNDPQFYFTDAEDLLQEYRNIAKKADAELPKLFGLLPRTPYGVTPVPAYAEQSQTTAYYEPGSLDTGRAGSFFANTYQLASRPKYEMEALTLHEAVPGHHLQIALQQEMQDTPWFRKIPMYTGFVEGWGLYAESLGDDMGFYQDPYSKFGQLTFEMWRAMRLVVDTGIHVFGWTRQQSIDYFMANSGKAEHDVTVEVDRYIVWPGQATAYKVGELKIKALRAEAEASLGESFDIREFHDVVLGSGAVPLTILEDNVNEWIAAEN